MKKDLLPHRSVAELAEHAAYLKSHQPPALAQTTPAASSKSEVTATATTTNSGSQPALVGIHQISVKLGAAPYLKPQVLVVDVSLEMT
jgi:hypothetical protein